MRSGSPFSYADKPYTDEHHYCILPTTISSDENAALTRGLGVWIWADAAKKRYFDACSQVSCANIGHNHPKFTQWMKEFWTAAERGEVITTVMGTDFYYKNEVLISHYDYARAGDSVELSKIELSPVALAERLAPYIFGTGNTVFGFHTSGAQAVNIAIRFFRTVTGKPYVIAFEKGFHGRDGESRDVSSSNPAHWDDAPRSGNVFFLPYPETDDDHLRAVEMLNDIPLKKCAAMIYEPVQGEGGGMRVGWRLRDLEILLKKEGVFSVSDEIQSGLGRCGTWWGYEALDLNPDAIVIGKTLGSGHPVSATAFKKTLLEVNGYEFPHGKISGTFSMSPVGIAAANFTMQIYKEERVVEQAENNAGILAELFQKMSPILNESGQGRCDLIDGIGLYRSIKPFFDGKPDRERRDALVRRLREFGVWTLGASRAFPAVRITPPLIATEEEIRFLGAAMAKAITQTKKPPRNHSFNIEDF